MASRESEIQQLRAQVYINPSDPFLQCNLACVLGSVGAYQAAMWHLGVAMEQANGPIAAGCVFSAIREITAEYARLWQLPESVRHLTSVSA